jgi:hypothetical protein
MLGASLVCIYLAQRIPLTMAPPHTRVPDFLENTLYLNQIVPTWMQSRRRQAAKPTRTALFTDADCIPTLPATAAVPFPCTLMRFYAGWQVCLTHVCKFLSISNSIVPCLTCSWILVQYQAIFAPTATNHESARTVAISDTTSSR